MYKPGLASKQFGISAKVDTRSVTELSALIFPAARIERYKMERPVSAVGRISVTSRSYAKFSFLLSIAERIHLFLINLMRVE